MRDRSKHLDVRHSSRLPPNHPHSTRCSGRSCWPPHRTAMLCACLVIGCNAVLCSYLRIAKAFARQVACQLGNKITEDAWPAAVGLAKLKRGNSDLSLLRHLYDSSAADEPLRRRERLRARRATAESASCATSVNVRHGARHMQVGARADASTRNWLAIEAQRPPHPIQP